MNITRKQILKYTLTPQILPRMQNLFGTGFGYLAYFIALVYSAVRLIPSNHPYTFSKNIGKFGIRHIVAEAANNLKFSFKNIDQIILFATILIGIAIGIIQIFLLIGGLFIDPVMAELPTNFSGFFISPNPEQDLAGMMMDMVFGVPGIFDSCVTGSAACLDINGQPLDHISELTAELSWPYPIHHGLHQMLAVYSTGLLIVGAVITFYFMATVLAETAQTGTPFGKRFNKVWAPIRIVVAFGLLIPVGNGLNSAQYITLYAAKYGSGFASNGWVLFNEELSAGILGEAETLISQPNLPELGGLVQFMYVAKVCKELEEADKSDDRPVKAYLVRETTHSPASIEIPDSYSAGVYEQVRAFANGGQQVTIRFGIHDAEEFKRYRGYVEPTCGDIKFNLKDPRPDGESSPGAKTMQQGYVELVTELWSDLETMGYDPKEFVEKESTLVPGTSILPLSAGFQQETYAYFTNFAIGRLDLAIKLQALSGEWAVEDSLKQKGWAGAGIWYNKIAELNGDLNAAVFAIPNVDRYPFVMEEVFQQKQIHNNSIDPKTRFQPELLAGSAPLRLDSRKNAFDKAKVMWRAYDLWNEIAASSHIEPTGNAFLDSVNALFGTSGLFSMRKNKDIHPLAQLVGVGRALVESSLNNIGYAMIGSGSSALVGLFSNTLGELGKVMVGFVITIAMFGLSLGFLLFYIIPFLPFVYFFFAVGGWVKGIFEALVGVPLWALAHIRIDGEGLPGDAAKNGYLLIFEIFLRPILIVFGLLASISIFGATVSVLNDIWDIVTSNLGGFDVAAELSGTDPLDGGSLESYSTFFRSALDEFFYTIVYTMLVYLMAVSSFKLIDEIPNNLLRWMGEQVSTFNEGRDDPTEGLFQTAYVGSTQLSGKVEGGLQGALAKKKG